MSENIEHIPSSLLATKLKDRNIKEVAKGAGVCAHTIYNFMAGRKELSLKSKCKLAVYFMCN